MNGVCVLIGNDPPGGKVTLPLAAHRSLLEALLAGGVEIAHECGGKLACASCRVIVLRGLDSLGPASEGELDILDAAGVAAPDVRLACQAMAAGGDIVLQIPKMDSLPLAATGKGDALPVSLTERAARHIAAQLAKRPAVSAVRLGVAPAGCSGFSYRVEFADAVRDDDVVFDSGGIRIAVDPSSLPRVRGTTLDLVQEGLDRRLRFDNPNARSTCGCGESFSV